MTTVEKLLVQIFDRKNSIIEQVKQQTELYNQHLASKLLIEGITPPSWIWSPNNCGSKELDKEELLARVLRPDPQPSARCSSVYYPFYNNVVPTRDNGEFFEGCLFETLASNKDINKQDDPVVPAVCPELGASITSPEDPPNKTCNKNHYDKDGPVMPASSENKACCASKNVPDQIFSITTPGDRTDERILDIYNASNQSLARIQRSKSRQKAIEHRGSAKSLPKSGLDHECSSGDLRLPSLPIEYSNQMNEPPKLVEHSVIEECCKDCLVDEYDHQHTEKGVDVYIGRVTRSRRNVKVPDFGSCSIGLSCSANNCRHVSSDVAGVRARSSSSLSNSKHGKHVMKSHNSSRPSALCFQSYRGMILDNTYCQETDTVTNSCDGVIARSKFLRRSQTFASDSSKSDSSSGNSHRKDNLTMEYGENLTVGYPDASLTRLNQADVSDEGFGSRELLADCCMGQKEMGVVDGYDEHCVTLISVANDCNIQKEIGSIDGCDTLRKSRCLSQENASAEKYPDGKVHSYNMEAGFRTIPFSTGEAALQASGPNQELGLVTPSMPVDLRTRSKSQAHEQETSNTLHHPEMHYSGNMLRSDLKRKTTSDECLNASGGDIAPPCKTHCKVHSHSMEADFRTSPFSIGEAALQASGHNHDLGLVTASLLVDLGTWSKSQVHEQEMSNALHHPEMHCSSSMPRSGLKRKTTSDECLNASGGDIASPCETHCEVNELGDAGMLSGSEFILCNINDPSDGISSIDANHRREMKSVAFSSNSSAFLEHKQLGFDVFEKHNTVYPTFGSGSERLDKSSKKIVCTLDPSTPVDKETPGAICQVSFAEELSDKSDFLSEGKKIWTDSLDLNCLEKLQTAENHAPTGSGYNSSRTCLNNTERSLNRQYSGVQDELGHVPSETEANPDLLIPVELHLEPVNDSFIDQHSEEENLIAEEQDFSILASDVSAGENCLLSSSLDPVNQENADDYLVGHWERTDLTVTAHEKIIQMQPEESQALPCLESEVSDQLADLPIGDNGLIRTSLAGSLEVEDFSFEKRFRRSCIKSWPNIKRRKIEHQQSYNCTTSANFRVRKLHCSQKGLASRYLQGIEMDAENMLIDASKVRKRIDMEMGQQIVFDLTEGLDFTLRTGNEEVPLSCKEINEHGSSSTVASDEQLRLTHVCSLTNKESRKSDHLGIKTPCPTNDYLNASDFDDTQCSIHSSCLDKDAYVGEYEKLTLSDRIGTKSSQLEDGQSSQCSMISPTNNDLGFISVDQCMPVYEGFSVDAQENCDDDFAADEIDFDQLNLPTTTTERASILAKICRSASMNTPLSNLSSSLEFQGTQDTFQSVHNGLTKSLDLKVDSSLNADVGNQIGYGSSLAYDVNYSLEGMPASDCLTYSGARYMGNLRNGYTSPVGKLWERLSYHTGSSETSLNSNPELTCFRIEEDQCISEENNSIDRVAGDIEEEIDSVSANHHNKRHPLTEMPNFSLVPPASDSVQDDTLMVENANFVSAKPSLVAAQNNIKQSTRKQTSPLGNSEVRKNQTSTIRANRMRKAKESVNSSVRKPVLRSKSSIRTPAQTLSFKESRKNNIVSNVQSFLPLVQQQKASICAGKRDVKVKALEAAEAAKRLEERKENERKIRKEALKIERAKVEERNLRQQELEKKRKEDERKKRDASVIVKKRLREEEERNEKEKKRMRLDARQKQKEQEEKIRFEKAEKEKQRSKEDRMNNKKELNESKKQQNKDIVKGVGSASGREETRFTPTAAVMNHNESSHSLEVGKALENTPTNAETIVQKARQNSYEISPYQGSDDENDEDEDLRTRKFIPAWARKSSVAQVLSSQQGMDPNVIFPSQRSCSMDDVLQPRKVYQK